MKEIKNRKQNPTSEESQLALQSQAPLDESKHEAKMVASFKQLAKVATSARQVFGGNGQWVKSEDLFRDDYRDGLESPPFVITNAFRYTSKALGDRMGIEIIMSNKRCYHIGFPLNESDSKRAAVLDHFVDSKGQLLGPVCLHKLDLGKGSAYYDIVPYDGTAADAPIEIPFEEFEFDNDIPF